MKQHLVKVNETVFASKEICGIGSAGTLRILRGHEVKFLNFVGRCLSYTSTRAYGSFLLSFGILSLLLNFGEYYFMSTPEVSLAALITSFVLVSLSVPLLIIDKPMCIIMQDISFTDKFLFEFLSIKRMHRNVKHASISPLLALFIGFIPAIIAFFVPLNIVILSLILLVVVLFALTSPEFSMMLTLIVLPYLPMLSHSVLILCCLSLLTIVSYGLKVILGKRVFNLDIYSVLLLLIALFAFISGVCSDGTDAFKNSVAFIAVLLAYFPASNIISNRRIADNAINAIIVSAIPIMLFSVIEFIVEHPKTSYVPPSYSTDGMSAFFSSPAALAAFMLVAVVATLTFAIEKRNKLKKAFYFVVSVLEISVLGLVMLPEVWIAVLIAALVYPIIKSKKVPIDVCVAFIFLPLLVFVLPNGFLDYISDFFGVGYSFTDRLSGYAESLGVFAENIFLGTGLGNSAYMISTGSHTAGIFNTFIGLAVGLGFVVFFCFLLVIVLHMRQLSYNRLYLRSSLVSVTGEMTAVAIVALLSFGMLADIFVDVTVSYIFWTVLGISTAALRIARKENQERQGYYGDSRSSESSALDIGIND